MPETKEIVVIKVGGGILLDSDATESLSAGVAAWAVDHTVVIVHGGGPQATDLAERMGHSPRIVHGRRVTSDLDLDLVLSTVCGVVNSTLVAALSATGVRAVGITGASAGMISASKRPPWTLDGEVVDFGHVGDIEEIDPGPLDALISGGFVPVVATVGSTTGGELLNINADTTATQIAITLKASKLLLVTSAGGLLQNGQTVSRCDAAQVEAGVSAGWITDGMRVKLATALEAAEAGVEQVAIVGPESLTSPDAGKTLLPDAHAASPLATPTRTSNLAPHSANRAPHTAQLIPRTSIDILKTLIGFPSITGDEEAIADWVEGWASDVGLNTGRFENNVYCWIGDGDDCLLLNSHLDVVPPSADHPYDPFDPVQIDEYIYGRGSVDAKASGSAMLAAIANLANEGWSPNGGKLLVALTECEEGTGKHNGLQTLLPHLPEFSGAIIGEPTSLQPCVSQKGLLILKASATGRSAHAARAELGENAIEKAARDISVLKDLVLDRIHPDLGPTSIAVTTISGGTARNVVPDECSYFIDIRTTPSYTHEEIMSLLETRLESTLSVHSGRYVPSATPEGSRIGSAVREALPTASGFGSPTVSDWAFLGDTPAIKLGPGDSRLSHTGTERIRAEEVESAVSVYSAIARAFFAQPDTSESRVVLEEEAS